MISAADLMAKVFPPLRYVVPGIISEGMTLLVAPPKAGKSWLALSLAYDVATGGRALGVIPTGRPRPVLYLALEDGERRLQDRMKIIGATQAPENLFFDTRVSDEQGVVNQLAEFMDTHHDEAPLVILDTLGKVAPGTKQGESDYQRDYRIGSTLKAVADRAQGGSLLVIHHTRKAGSDDFVDSVSGTQGLAGAADTILVLKRSRGEDSGPLSVTSRDAKEGSYKVEMQGARWVLCGDSLDAAATAFVEAKQVENLGDRSAELVAVVNRFPDGVSPSIVAESTGIDNDTAGRYLRRLAESGRITKAARGTYRPLSEVSGRPNQLELSDTRTQRTPSITTRNCTSCGMPLAFDDGSGSHVTCEAQ